MSELDYRGARASNAGDEFHELWAVRQALALLEPDTELKAITVEGVLAGDQKPPSSDVWDGVDCALYYGGDSVAKAGRIDLIQLKYSPSDPNERWTTARLCSSTAKKRNNSVLRRMSTAFEAARQERDGSQAGIRIQLISNQPVHADVVTLFAAIASNAKLVASMTKDKEKARKAAALKGEDFRRFAAAIDWRQDASRFAVEESILRTISAWTEGDARLVLNNLQSYVARMMTPEGRDQWITKESVFAQFGFSDSRAIYPCPAQVRPVVNLIHRVASDSILAAMREDKRYICIHGPAGCGKTTALQEIQNLLPQDSLILVFDCYGAGRYLDADAYRHSPKDAFLQLSNELAATLRVPLLLTRSDGADYARAFHSRLLRAAEVLEASAPTAWLVVAVDAADNSITAAQQMVPPQRSFVQDFMALGGLPDNVRLLVSTRSVRLNQLHLPTRFQQIPLEGFSGPETAQLVRSIWPAAPDDWIDDFHYLSGGNPRVQRYALAVKKDEPQSALSVLLPGGKKLNDVFQAQLEEAGKKAGREEPLDRFAAALTVLPHPAPVPEIAAITGLTEGEVADICADLAPGIRVTGPGVGFADEDFEAFIRERGASSVAATRAAVADRFLARHQSDAYPAMHLATALYDAGRGKELLDLIEKEAQPKAISDPIVRREVGFQRLQAAMHVCAETQDQASMLRTILVGAEAMRSAEAIFALIVKNPDLAAAFMRDSAVRTLLLDGKQQSHHGRLLFHIMLEDARAGNAVGARTTRRQLGAWLDRRSVELGKEKNTGWPQSSDNWKITAEDVAAHFETVLLLDGGKAAIQRFKKCPPALKNRAGQILVRRLVASGQTNRVEEILSKPGMGDLRSIFLLVPLALAGRRIDLSRLVRALERVRRRRWIALDRVDDSRGNKFPSSWLETVITSCEILIARGGKPKDALPVLTLLSDPAHRQIDRLHTSDTRRLDIQLRACALVARLAGKALALETFLITPPESRDRRDARSRRYETEHRERLNRFVNPLVSVYDARAQLIIGGLSDAQRAEALRIIGAKLDDYSFSREYEFFDMRRRTAKAVGALRSVPGILPSELLPRALGVFGERLALFGTDELAVLPIFASEASLHGGILKLMAQRVRDIVSARAVASEKIDALLEISRFVAPINRDEAAAYFSEAHRMTEEIDLEVMHQIRAMSSVSFRAADSLTQDERRQVCQRFHTIVTDAAIRLSYQEEFPWDTAIETLARLDFGFALACIARWQDSGTKDLTTAFSAFLVVCRQADLLSPKLIVALLPLLGYASADLLNGIATSIGTAQEEDRDILADEVARDALLRFGQTRITDVSESLVQHLPPQHTLPPWVSRVRDTAAFLKQSDEKLGPQGHASQRHGTAQTGPAVSLPSSERFISPAAIIQVVESAVLKSRETGRYVSASDVLQQIRAAVLVADRIPHLEALAAIRSELISDYIVAEAIYHAILDSDWNGMASVRAWCRTHLPQVIIELLPGFAHGFGYGGRPPLPPLLSVLAAEGIDVAALLARAIGEHVDELSARVVYELVRLMAERMRPEDCASTLVRYLERMRGRVPPADIDEIELAEVPTDSARAIARFLFALMSDCDVRIRWNAAHAMRRIAAFGLREPFDFWVQFYDRMSEKAFRAAKEPFYWLSARLWSVIVINRVADETPSVLAGHFPLLVNIATDTSLPHVLIRELAKNAALHLLERGAVKKPTAQTRKLLVNALPSKIGLSPKGRC